MAQITIQDIAKEVNVSTSTVARALSGSGYVSADKKQSINDAIARLGYVPNRMAQNLRKKRSNLIGHILYSERFNPFFGMIGDALDSASDTAGYRLLSFTTTRSAEKEKAMVQEMVSQMVEGIILTGGSSLENDVIEWLKRLEIPLLMIERPRDITGIDKLFIDNEEGAKLAVDYILRQGHRRIAYIGTEPCQQVEAQRYNGYANALLNKRIAIDSSYIVYAKSYSILSGYESAKILLEGRQHLPTCIFTASDVLACGILQYLYEKKLRVPEDISVVGYDNTSSVMLSPPLTTVGIPYDEIGRSAIEMIIEKCENGRTSNKNLTLSPELIIRNSVKAL